MMQLMDWTPRSVIRTLFASEYGASNRLIPRWLFLRALGLIYFSAFYSLVFQIRGLIGPQGILPAGEYLQAVARSGVAHVRLWYAPSLLWISSSSGMLMALCWIGMIASLLLVLNFWPRAMLVSRNGGISLPWMSITKMVRCQRGLDGTCSICRIGFMRAPLRPRW